MKLYHGTESENTKSIMNNGLWPTDCGNKVIGTGGTGETLQGKDYYGVYAFTSMDEAIWFTQDNGCDGAVFEIETDNMDVIDDPEYTGEAKFIITENPIQAKLVWEQYPQFL